MHIGGGKFTHTQKGIHFPLYVHPQTFKNIAINYWKGNGGNPRGREQPSVQCYHDLTSTSFQALQTYKLHIQLATTTALTQACIHNKNKKHHLLPIPKSILASSRKSDGSLKYSFESPPCSLLSSIV